MDWVEIRTVIVHACYRLYITLHIINKYFTTSNDTISVIILIRNFQSIKKLDCGIFANRLCVTILYTCTAKDYNVMWIDATVMDA